MSGRGGPGGNSRGRGGKFKKFTRGGGKHFSRDLKPLDADGNEISMWSADARKKKKEENDNDSVEDSEEESDEDSDEDSDNAGPSSTQELSREERKQQKAAAKAAAIAKKKKAAINVGDMPSDTDSEESDEDMPANPNHSKAARNMTKVQPPVDEATEGVKKLAVTGNMNRKEREAKAAEDARERYRKLHEAGKTDEAQADLERLRLIKEKREATRAQKEAEKQEEEERVKEKKAEFEAKEAKRREAALGKGIKKGKK